MQNETRNVLSGELILTRSWTKNSIEKGVKTSKQIPQNNHRLTYLNFAPVIQNYYAVLRYHVAKTNFTGIQKRADLYKL